MKKVLIFAGTLEGRLMAEFMAKNGVETKVCVATEYGESLYSDCKNLDISSKRLTADEMAALMVEFKPEVVIDATHPYAAVVTDNVKAACEVAAVEYLRLLRPSQEVGKTGDTVYVDDELAAIEYLKTTTGNVFLSTGSKELPKFTALPDYQERLFARVLSLPKVVAEVADLGFCGAHLIAMQGPFSYEINKAMFKQCDAKILVTKDTGRVGGFEEKYDAAIDLGMQVVIIGRPSGETGLSFNECKKALVEKFELAHKTAVTIVGIGAGNLDTMTLEAKAAIAEADLLIGAKRMLEETATCQDTYADYNPKRIKEYVDSHPEYEKVAILQSGDVGFYSGTLKLLQEFNGDVKLIAGISSPIYFCSKLQIPWSHVKMSSLHGRRDNVVAYIKKNQRVFTLVGDENSASDLCKKLIAYGMSDVTVHIGERLSYDDEKISSGSPADFVDYMTNPLAVILVENPKALEANISAGIVDDAFTRAKVPMTKEEIRAISIAKLQLKRNSVMYDIGAGTGSISIEAAEVMEDGYVYAIEKKAEAVELIGKNKVKFALDNLEVVEGLAPEALVDLPTPTHAFIGGSSGNLQEIMELLLAKNPSVRIVINCIALETVAESLAAVKNLPVKDVDIASVSIAKSKKLGSYNMMMGLNPIYVVSCTGGVEND